MNKIFNKKIISFIFIIFSVILIFVANTTFVISAEIPQNDINLYGDTEFGKKAKEQAKEDVIKFQQNEALKTEQNKGFVPLEPEFFEAFGKDADKDLSSFFNGLFTFGIAIAGFLAVVMIAIGGIQYMSTDAVSGKGEGRERITYALMGLLLILFSWILLNTINPDILNFDLFN